MDSKFMSRGEANSVCVGDEVEMLSGHKCTVKDLEYSIDSNNDNQIVATLVENHTGIIRKTNLLMCRKL